MTRAAARNRRSDSNVNGFYAQKFVLRIATLSRISQSSPAMLDLLKEAGSRSHHKTKIADAWPVPLPLTPIPPAREPGVRFFWLLFLRTKKSDPRSSAELKVRFRCKWFLRAEA